MPRFEAGFRVVRQNSGLTIAARQPQVSLVLRASMDRFDMPVPDFQSLMLPVLRATADGDISAADLRSRLADELGLTEADLTEMLPSGRPDSSGCLP